RQIRLSDHPCTWKARRTRAIVSTDFTPHHPLATTSGWSQIKASGGSKLDADSPAYGVNFARRFTLGKTVALNWIASQSGAAYCEVAQHTKAIRPMFLMLHDAYGVQRDSKHTYDLAKIA
ncbi:hypothetical protein, partial [Mesorhizobium sp. B2-4-9]|uniref:hypothetical protein n=1 Tax=Mesorhizobium sp. B2-4-9 TaxID=2589940 RepID=UPI001AED363A